MHYDTDVLIWLLRGNLNAARTLDGDDDRRVSAVTYMELLQGARDSREVRSIKALLFEFSIRTIPLTENIGHRASIYMEEYGLQTDLGLADALLAATAVEIQMPFCTANTKHYRLIKEIDLRTFRP
jgi:predicted nucleic acid-binding protein